MKRAAIWAVIFILVVMAGYIAAHAKENTYRVYDKNGKALEIWKEKDGLIEIYDTGMKRKGYIKKEDGREEIYDKDWRRKGYIDRDGSKKDRQEEP